MNVSGKIRLIDMYRIIADITGVEIIIAESLLTLP